VVPVFNPRQRKLRGSYTLPSFGALVLHRLNVAGDSGNDDSAKLISINGLPESIYHKGSDAAMR